MTISSPPTPLILAYGNPLRGDDGVGWQAAILISRELKGQVEVLARHQLTPELAELISERDRVVFIDAADHDPPGQVCCQELQCTRGGVQAFTHQVSPLDLLVAAKELYDHAPVAHLITVNGSVFDYREALSPAVEAALPNVVAQVKNLMGIADLSKGKPDARSEYH